ncbi:MAG: hypothetical protein FWE05_04460 [Defluviitaleaceae bacterium]|nr:hypothetical protein [Defluviitaleaceae bacterium]
MFKNKKKLIIALSVVLIIVAVVLIINFNNTNIYNFDIKSVEAIESIEVFNKDIDHFFDFDKDLSLINVLYVTDPEFSYFMASNKYNRLSTNFSLPMLYYYIKFTQNILQEEIDEELIPRIEIFISNRINEIEDDGVLQLRFSNEEIYFLSKIDFWIENESNLAFYISTIYELIKLEEYTGVYMDTFEIRVLIRTLDVIGYFSDELQDFFYNRLVSLMNSEDYFGANSIKFSLSELELLSSSIIFNRISDGHKYIDLNQYKEWYSDQVDIMSSLLYSDEIDLIVLSSIVTVFMQCLNDFYSIDFDEHAYSHFVNRLKMTDFNEIFFYTYSFVYSGLSLLKDENLYYIERYLANARNFGNLISLRTNFSDIGEQFFGLLISKTLGFNIDEYTFMNHIKLATLRNIREAYFFLLISNELHSPIGDEHKYEISRLIDENLTQVHSLDSIAIYRLLNVLILMDTPLLESDYERIVYAVSNLDDAHLTDEHFFYNVMLRDMLNLELELAWMQKILNEYHVSEGVFSLVTHSPDGVNILSTFRMLRLAEMFNLDIELSVEDAMISLSTYRGYNGGYFFANPYIHDLVEYENYRDNFTLESWFFGLLVHNLIYALSY